MTVKVLFCSYCFRPCQLLKDERTDIVFMAPILFYTDNSHILIKNKKHYGDIVLWHIVFLYLTSQELFECICFLS
jgi:hypothetical protein